MKFANGYFCAPLPSQKISACAPDLKYYILGDVNIDIFQKSNRMNHGLDFLNLLCCNSAIPIISEYTGISKNSQTPNDHILTNDHTNSSASGAYTSHILSDHYSVFDVITFQIAIKSFLML